MDDPQQVVADLKDFDEFLNDAFEVPDKLFASLDEIESRVAVLTKGWRGTDDKENNCRWVFKDIMVKLHSISFFVRDLRERLKKGGKTAEYRKDLLEAAITDKKLRGKIVKRVEIDPVDPIPKEYWDAIRLNFTIYLGQAVKTGVENRIKKEEDERHEIEKLRAQNVGLALSGLMQNPGGLPSGISKRSE
jgi:hypothetical protein